MDGTGGLRTPPPARTAQACSSRKPPPRYSRPGGGPQNIKAVAGAQERLIHVSHRHSSPLLQQGGTPSPAGDLEIGGAEGMQMHGYRPGPEAERRIRKRSVRIPRIPPAVKSRIPAQGEFFRQGLGPVIQISGNARLPHALEHVVQPPVPLGIGAAPVHNGPPP